MGWGSYFRTPAFYRRRKERLDRLEEWKKLERSLNLEQYLREGINMANTVPGTGRPDHSEQTYQRRADEAHAEQAAEQIRAGVSDMADLADRAIRSDLTPDTVRSMGETLRGYSTSGIVLDEAMPTVTGTWIPPERPVEPQPAMPPQTVSIEIGPRRIGARAASHAKEVMRALLWKAITAMYEQNEDIFDYFFEDDREGFFVKITSAREIKITNKSASLWFKYRYFDGRITYSGTIEDNENKEANAVDGLLTSASSRLVYFEYQEWDSMMGQYTNSSFDPESGDFDAETYNWLNSFINEEQELTSDRLISTHPNQSQQEVIVDNFTSFGRLQFLTQMVLSTVVARLIRHTSIDENVNEYFKSLLFEQRTWGIFITGHKVIFLEENAESYVEYSMSTGRSLHITDSSEVALIGTLFQEKKVHQIVKMDVDSYTHIRSFASRSDVQKLLAVRSSTEKQFISIIQDRDPEYFRDNILFVSKYEKIMDAEQEGSIKWCRASASFNQDRQTKSALDYILNICATAQMDPSNWNFKVIFYNTDGEIRVATNSELNKAILADRQPNEFLGVQHIEEGPKKITARDIDKILSKMDKVLAKDEETAAKELMNAELEYKEAQKTLDSVTPKLKDLRMQIGKYTAKDQQYGIRNSCERLIKSGAYSFEGIKEANGLSYVHFRNTYPFVMVNNSNGKLRKINIGLFDLWVCSKTFSIYMLPIDNNETPFRLYKHPYLPNNEDLGGSLGNVLCTGDAHDKIKGYLLKDDYFALMMLIRDLMNSYDPGNPYVSIETFEPFQDWIDDFNNQHAKWTAGKTPEKVFQDWMRNSNQRLRSSDHAYGWLAFNVSKKTMLFNVDAHKFFSKEF